jgi:hypothetical protein
MNNSCSICKQRQVIASSTPVDSNTIWGFNPYIYLSFNQMKNAFFFYLKSRDISRSFYTTHNEEGYTYTQWQIYYISKNTAKAKKLHKQTFWLFTVLSEYTFFTEMIKMGSITDPLYHTLLHFIKYMEKYGPLQQKMVALLEICGLRLTDKDANGYSGEYYLLDKIMDQSDIIHCNQLTREYKKVEDELFDIDDIAQYLQTCEECHQPIDKFSDLKKIPIDIIQRHSDLLQTSIKKRTECNEIYKRYIDTNASIERHQHVIDMLSAVAFENQI